MLDIPQAHAACANVDAYRYSSGLWAATDYAINQTAATAPGLFGDDPLEFLSGAKVVYCPWNLLSGDSRDFLA
jgi:hypothetical protein